MDSFFRDALCSVFTLTINELIVLSHGRAFLTSNLFQEKDPPNKLENKCGIEAGRSTLPIKTLNEIKVYNELKKLVDIYTDIMDELQSTGTIKILTTTINLETTKKQDEQKVIEEHNSRTSMLRNLKLRLTEFKSEGEEKLLTSSEILNGLKSDWRIISKVNELEYELVKKWEHTRYTQAVINGEKEEKTLEKNFENFVAKTKTERRVIFEFEVFSKRQLDEYLNLIEIWKKKYSKEMAELMLNITDKENKIKAVNKTYSKHYEIFCKRRMFIKEYLEQKAEQNRLNQLEMQRIESAVKIQAWWRGLMVRKCLGPFRKKNKKGKKGKKGK